MNDVYCPMIHAGLQINLKNDKNKPMFNHCCLRTDLVSDTENFWKSKKLIPLRELNNTGVWDEGCWTCRSNELSGQISFRTGMLSKFGITKNLTGPKRLDLMSDISCNLACRICGPGNSTFWQQHLKKHNISFTAPSFQNKTDEMIEILKTLDLSNLEMVVMCGGETLLGQSFWRIAEAIAEMCPQSKDKIILSFQTNGTQPIDPRNYELMEKFHLVKLYISIDGVGERFNYQRWPADWTQVVDNIFNIRDNAPVNTMFLVEETISMFNLFYQHELESWLKKNFYENRLGDKIDHTKHLVNNPYFGLSGFSQEYVDALPSNNRQYFSNNWVENPTAIDATMRHLAEFDKLRSEDWTKTFPEIAEFYKRFKIQY